ncbi:MAG: hypothetical protein JNM84_22760 [Planctomycetes bacterium]|nr:hypothetical protein [Planctomycetota bacterium]
MFGLLALVGGLAAFVLATPEDEAQAELRHPRQPIAGSPPGELWLPLPGAPCDPSGRYLRLAKHPAGAPPTTSPEERWALDLQQPGALLRGEPWLPAELPPLDPPPLFPPPPTPAPSAEAQVVAAELGVELVLWPGSAWQLALAREPRPNGERALFLLEPRTRASRPLGVLRGARSFVRLDHPRRRALLCELGADGRSALAWLPLDAEPAPLEPRWIDGDEPAAHARAVAEGRPIFAALRIPSRALGEFLESRTLVDPRVRAELQRAYVPLKLDAHARRERFEQLFGERGALGCAVLAEDGEAIAVRKGFLEPELLLELLAQAEELLPRWREARARWRECPRDPAAQLAFALVRFEGDDAMGAEPLLWSVLCDGDELQRARAHAELARLEVDRGRVQEALQHLARYHALDPLDRAGARARADLTAAILARARRRPAQAARLLEETLAYASPDFALPLRLIELSLAWHEEGNQPLGKRGLETVARRYAGTVYGGQAEACLQHMTVPHGH